MERTRYFHLLLIFVTVLVCTGVDAWATADLAVDNVDADEGKVYFVGGDIHVDLDIQNRGTSPSGSYTVYVYASTEGSHTGLPPNVDYLIGSRERGPVDADQHDWFSVECVFPTDIPERRYIITAAVVCSGDAEPGNNRNYYDWSVRVIVPSPNLMVQSVDVLDGYYRPGDELSVSIAIKNLGELDSGGYSIDCYASMDTGASTGGFSIGGAGSGSLGPGQQTTVSLTGALPTNIPAGEYFIKVVAACGGDDDLRNNSGYDPAKIPVGPFADLTLQSVQVASGTYLPGDLVPVRVLIRNAGEKGSANYTIRYYVSVDNAISTRDYSIGRAECAGLAVGQLQDLTTTCRLPSYLPTGKCYVGAIITCAKEANPRNNVLHDGAGITLIHPAKYVCGQAKHEDTSGWNHPIRYALVKVYDTDNNNDPTDDRVIGETSTDGDGNYGIRLTTDAANGPEVYVKIFTEGVSGACPGTTSKICTVKDHVLKQLYSLRSINYPYPFAGSVMIPLTSPRTAGEFMVYDSVVEGFEKTRQFFSVELDPISAYWPTSNGQTYYAPGEGIFVSMDDRGDRDVIMHEYGHYVADSSGFALGSVGEDPIHYWNLDLRIRPSYRSNKEARNLAFREAWATLFGVATQYGDSGYPYVGDSKYQDVDEITRKAIVVDLEGDTSAHKAPGEYYEHMNCCALWDIFDDTCDSSDNEDTLSDPRLVRIWTIASGSKPADILDFWNAWFTRFGDIREFNRIFWDHGMSFKAPLSTPTIETFETGDFSAFAWTSGSPSWVVVPAVGRQQSYGAKAADIGNNQSSTLEVTMECDDGWIYFWVKTSSEQPWDPLRFFIDGVKMEEWAGETDWKKVAFPVTNGKRRFTWTFVRDVGGSGGANTAWIDEIEFPLW